MSSIATGGLLTVLIYVARIRRSPTAIKLMAFIPSFPQYQILKFSTLMPLASIEWLVLDNPVKHGYASKPVDWNYSSIHQFIIQDVLKEAWTCNKEFNVSNFGYLM